MESSGGCCGGSKKQTDKSKPVLKVADPYAKINHKTSVAKVMETKVVLLGDSGVGKSSIAQRFCRGIFQDSHDVTIGGAYLQQTVALGQPSDSTQVKMHIWDTGGSEKFRSMVSLYYKDAAAAIICYDISDEKSFSSVFYWINEMLNNNNAESDSFVLALCGNKTDLDDSLKKVSYQAALEVAKKHNMIMAECSAKTGDGVQRMF
jgi:small GTP-binding protein